MLSNAELDAARARAAGFLAREGLVMTQAELEAMEIADFGLSSLDETGLEIVVYVNTERAVSYTHLDVYKRQTFPYVGLPYDGYDTPSS